jgi:CPA1 family monovalent cation:H+ antiporter
MELNFGKDALLLLLVAAVVAMLTRRLRLPYSVGLVAAGMALALLPLAPKISFTKELIFDALLPPLLFEAAFYLRWNQLRREIPVILTLASAGVVLSGAVTAMGMHYAARWQWPSALVFGSLIAATDPVSVIATFRDARVHGRLRLLIEAESLFNDGTAAVAFGIAVLFATGYPLTAVGLAKSLLATVGGALLCGSTLGGIALFLTRRTEDHLVELTFTTVAAYGSFLLAEQFHFSGVFATIAAGLIIGNRGPRDSLSDHGREAVQSFWEYAAFVANSLVFLLIGMRETSQNIVAVWLPSVIAVLRNPRPRSCRLSALPTFRQIRSACDSATSTRAALGRATRCTRPRIGSRLAGGITWTRRNHHSELCRRRFLCLCSGLDDAAAVAGDRGNSPGASE